MKLSRSQGVSLFAAFMLFGIFNTVVFLADLTHTVVFWLGYFFALFALATVVSTLVLYFGKSAKEEKFLSLPAVKTVWTYFVLQTLLSAWEMIAFPLPYLPALVINLVLGAVFAVVALSLYAASGRIEKNEQFTAEKVVFIKQLKLKVESIETDDVELAKEINELAENIRFSDPMSHSMLNDIENSLSDAVDELADNIADISTALELCKKASKILKKRNEQCKMYKGVKDTVAAAKQKSGGGSGIAFAGASITLAMFLITLAVCFIVIPQTKYMDAFALLEASKYDEAASAFAELGDYRDSKEKIKEIKFVLFDNQYSEAEKLFNEGKYSEAIGIYTLLGDFKDSKLRVEQIYNRLSEGDILYFGTYNGEPIAWKILKTESNKMLLISEKAVAQKPFNDKIKKVTWKTCYLRTWLNEEFIQSFSNEQQKQIIPTDTGDTTDKIFLFSVDEIDELVKEKRIIITTSDEWWTRTSSDDIIMYTTANGFAEAKGDHVVRDKGVRPAIWISLD